jgi:hypothetical protein
MVDLANASSELFLEVLGKCNWIDYNYDKFADV